MSMVDSSFKEMLQRLRSGDVDTVRAFVAKYEPYIRRTLRRRLARTPLQAAADSADLCQSVLAHFLIHMAAGSYVLNSQEHLVRLLLGMAHKKFAQLARRETADCRDRRRLQSLRESDQLEADPAQQPYHMVECQDLFQSVAQRLDPHERRLFELRKQGHDWESIADLVGGSAGVLRKQLSRGLHRVTAELDLEPG